MIRILYIFNCQFNELILHDVKCQRFDVLHPLDVRNLNDLMAQAEIIKMIYFGGEITFGFAENPTRR